MSLNQYVAEKRLAILEDLKAGHDPREGSFDQEVLKETKTKGHPQMGSTHYEPNAIFVEFIFPNSLGAPLVLSVRLPSPERIVYLPIPSWVVENVWQGEVEGSYQFESEAMRLVAEFQGLLTPDRNPSLFAERQAIGKA